MKRRIAFGLWVCAAIGLAGCGPQRPHDLCHTWVLHGLEMPPSDLSPDSARTAQFLAQHRGRQAFGLAPDGAYWLAMPVSPTAVDTLHGTWEYDPSAQALVIALPHHSRTLRKQLVARTDTSLATQDVEVAPTGEHVLLPGTLHWRRRQP